MSLDNGIRLKELTVLVFNPINFDTPYTCLATMENQKILMREEASKFGVIQIFAILGFIATFSFMGLLALIVYIFGLGWRLISADP